MNNLKSIKYDKFGDYNNFRYIFDEEFEEIRIIFQNLLMIQ